MKRLGEICSISYYALEKSDVVIDEYTFSVISKSLESVFKMVPIAAHEKNIEAQHSGGVASKRGTANKSSLTCLCKEGDLHYRKVVDGVIVEASLSYEVNKECPIHGHYMR